MRTALGAARTLALIAALGAVATALISASTVLPLGFGQLVSGASVIFTGEVVRTEPHWVSVGEDRAIVTTVTFRVERLLKGEVGAEVSAEFLGGRVGDTALTVAGALRLVVGDRGVVCLDTTRPLVSPIVGLNQGWFPVRRQPGTGIEYVTTFDSVPLPSVDSIGQPPITVSAVPIRTMTRQDLELAILREMRATQR